MFIVDRFENDYAILEENDKYYNVRKDELPANTKEGDVIIFHNNQYQLDDSETNSRRAKTISKQNNLWK